MARLRVERLREEYRREVSDILRRMKDPRLGFVTVTDVEMSSDLRHVKVFVSVLGSDEDLRRTMDVLEQARGYVRTEAGRRIRLRYTPEVTFQFDPSVRRGARVMTILNQLREPSGTPPADPATGQQAGRPEHEGAPS
ncbi:MAG: 30S ribosome-binding factor RbfA [Limnochordaceae bacterium]|uniref:Ribosome-binding factor A n=1 Tax=Carboxydichorda subterranea TaxID=3109565 RepID=A0ABZ1C0L4_9FIRM|nr:30S ribosome-binding factor RbfA [Limnochorda sp. L945t]MBE3597988.1 30S ribosome-binding factor RbfA [Limnochordaceae bacterium]WRP18484.1 30S ribosome-binding factor RbfA [Limnochorda sp. L945t]